MKSQKLLGPLKIALVSKQKLKVGKMTRTYTTDAEMEDADFPHREAELEAAQVLAALGRA